MGLIFVAGCAFQAQAQAIDHSSEEVRGHYTSEEVPLQWWHVMFFILLPTVPCCGNLYRLGYFDNMLDKPRPEEDAHNKSGADPLHVRGVDVPREVAKDILKDFYQEFVCHNEGCYHQNCSDDIMKAFAWDKTRFRRLTNAGEKKRLFTSLCNRLGIDSQQFLTADPGGMTAGPGWAMPTVVGMTVHDFPPQVPAGPGGQTTIQVRAAPAGHTTMQVAVPEGTSAGQSMTIDAGGGQLMSVVVPEGVQAGQTFQVNVPAPKIQPVMVTAEAVPTAVREQCSPDTPAA